MDRVFRQHVSSIVLAIVLFLQVIGLAMQIKRPMRGEKVPLIRIWAVTMVTPFENGIVHVQDFFRHIWRDYFYLHDVREENDRLRDENARLRLDQVNMAEDVGQAHRLQSLLGFKKQFIADTVAAQVVGGSGSEQSRVIYIDKGANDGIKPDMAVIAPTGVVGKVISVYPSSAQVLEINDQSSGVGAVLEKSRLQGILRGNVNGEATLRYVMTGEKVEVGESVLTSGGDRIFPKGLPIGEVTSVGQGRDVFLDIRVKPSARLDKLEEVLVITKSAEQSPDAPAEGPVRAIDILAERLPTVPPKPPDAKTPGTPGTTPDAAPNGASGTNAGTAPKPGTTANDFANVNGTKPGGSTAKPNSPSATPAGASKSGKAMVPSNPATVPHNSGSIAKPAASTANGGTTQNAGAKAPGAVLVSKPKPSPGMLPPSKSIPGASGTQASQPVNSGVKTISDFSVQAKKAKSAQATRPATTSTPSAAPDTKPVTKDVTQ
jgi:rod shape-determining protein MreC